MKRKYLLSSIVIAALMIVTSFSIMAPIGSSLEQTQKARIAAYVPHDPIGVNGNADFATQAIDESWPGDGTLGNPYIIENLEIVASGDDGIEISSTTVYFIIRNCYIHDGGSSYIGIKLSICENGIVTGNICENNLDGVYLEFSNGNTVYNNTLTNSDNTWQWGINLIRSSGNTVFDNICSDNEMGIGVEFYCNYNLIMNNTCNSNLYDGIILDVDCNNNTISNNYCSDNTNVGINVLSCNGTIISNNTCLGNNHGFYAASLQNLTMSDNEYCNNLVDGVYIEYSNHIIMNNNTCNDNEGDSGIWTTYADNVTAIGNVCNSQWYGLYVDNLRNFTLNDNICNDNGEQGIFVGLGDSRNGVIDNNTCINNLQGIYLDGLRNCTVTNNICSNNNQGISLSSSSSNIIMRNAADSNSNIGIYLQASSNSNIVSNNTCSNGNYGIAVSASSGNALSNNTCSLTNMAGMRLSTSSGNVLSNNNCSNNYIGITIYRANGNALTNNTCDSNSYYGIFISASSSNNIIWNNTLTENNGGVEQAADSGIDNLWNSPYGYGNWWSDWKTPDVAAPYGIVDIPYDITGSAGAQDHYPRATLTVTIVSPTSGSTYFTNWGYIKIDGVSYSNMAVTNVTWSNSLGGYGAAYMIPQFGGANVSWQSRGNVQLFDGDNVITVTASDVNGNSATDTMTITYEKVLPICTIIAPTSSPTYSTNSATVDLGGSASDTSGILTVTWKNKATGASGTAAGTDDWSITGIALNVGMNLIYVNATDNAGNKISDAIWVTYSVDTLTVTITAPTSSPTMATSWHYIKLMGTASDDVKVTSVTWSDSLGGSGIAYMNPQWGGPSVSWQSRGNVHLLPGDNVITVTATDSNGNTATDILTVTYTGL